MANVQRFLGRHRYMKPIALLAALTLLVIALWPHQARGQANEEHEWIRPTMITDPVVPWPTDCTRTYTAACLPVQLTVSDLPLEWQAPALAAAATWTGTRSALEIEQGAITDEIRPIMATYTQDGASVDLVPLAVGELRIIPSDMVPALDMGNYIGLALPYANPKEPGKLIAALIVLSNPLPSPLAQYYLGQEVPEHLAPGNIDMQSLITHEIGHAVGLPHTPDRADVMYTYEDDASVLVTGFFHRELSDGDLEALARLYGSRIGVSMGNFLRVRNNGEASVCGLYVTRSSWPYWGENLLEDATLEPGQTRELLLIPGPYDARVVGCDGELLREEYRIDLRQSVEWLVSAVGPSQNAFVVQNSSGAAICELYVSTSSSPTWGPELLGGTRIEPGRSYGFGLDPGLYDARAVACDGTKLLDAYGLDVRQPFTWEVRSKELAPVPSADEPTAVPPTAVPPTAVPPTAVPPTAVPPTPTAESCWIWDSTGPGEPPAACP